jgi:hypothetical protein
MGFTIRVSGIFIRDQHFFVQLEAGNKNRLRNKSKIKSVSRLTIDGLISSAIIVNKQESLRIVLHNQYVMLEDLL